MTVLKSRRSGRDLRDDPRTDPTLALKIENRSLRISLLMAAAHCQGGHSEAGARIADVLGTKFPLTMEGLAKVARKEGLDRDKLWPWWKTLRDKRSAVT